MISIWQQNPKDLQFITAKSSKYVWNQVRTLSPKKSPTTCLYHTVSCNLTHWGRVTHICVSKLTIIGSDNGLSPGRHQAIIWTNAGGIWWIGPLGTKFSEISIEIHIFPFKEMHSKMSSGKWRPFCLSLNVLMIKRTSGGSWFRSWYIAMNPSATELFWKNIYIYLTFSIISWHWVSEDIEILPYRRQGPIYLT